MLTSIHQDGKTLHLKTKTCTNLFDIDSMSLLIGPNGSGKTRFLQRTIESFLVDDAPTPSKNCRLSIDFKPRTNPRQFSEKWSLVYFNPLPLRTEFRDQLNFTNASFEKNTNLFDLIKHNKILEGFGLEVKLFAELRPNVQKIMELFSIAVADNRKFLHREIAHHPIVKMLSDTIIKRKNISDFDANQKQVEEIENRHFTLLNELANQLRLDFEKSANRRAKNGTQFLTAVLSVVQHMIEQKTHSIQKIVAFATAHIHSELIDSHSYPNEDINDSNLLLLDVLQILRTLPFIEDKHEPLHCASAINPVKHRKLFEQSAMTPIFTIRLPGMSSGQEAIITQINSIYSALKKTKEKRNILLMIDEGDAFLHLAWQRRYIWQMNSFLSQCKKELEIENLQLIIATHSPLLMSDIPREFVCELEEPEDNIVFSDIEKKQPEAANEDVFGGGPHSQSPSFAAPIHAILNLAFESSTIGEFATRTINKTIKNLKSGQFTARDRYLISIVDDPIIKRELQSMIPNGDHS